MVYRNLFIQRIVQKTNILGLFCLLAAGVVSTAQVHANKQVITTDPTSIDISKASEDEFTLNISYDTDPTGTETTGIGVKTFFDSSKLTFVSLTVESDDDLLQATTAAADIQADSGDADSDSSTDKFANVAYTAFGGDFAAPVSPMFKIVFKPATTSYIGTTKINYVLSLAAGFTGEASSVTVTFKDDEVLPELSNVPETLMVSVTDDNGAPATESSIKSFLEGVTASDNIDGDITSSITNDAPSTFPNGDTTVTFTVTDSSGNVATASTVVSVVKGPKITVGDSITWVSADSSSVLGTNAVISALIGGATGVDFSGNAVDVTNDAPSEFPLGATTVTFSATDSDGRAGSASVVITIVAPLASGDADSDGMDDLFEVNNSLDPNVDDASGDPDGDGLNNLGEYQASSDPNKDDVAPVVTAPAGVQVTSTGKLTAATLGDAAATDAKDGTLTVSADDTGPYAIGTTTVTWTATDAAGNAGTAEQSVIVIPFVETLKSGRVGEGATFTLKAIMNGAASAYPVEVPVTFSGTATKDTDYTVSASSISIASGTEGSIDVSVLSDSTDEGTETIIATLGTPASGAGLGGNVIATINVVEAAVEPALKLSVDQGGKAGKFVAADAGNVTVTLAITDPNGTHTVDWSKTDSNLVADAGSTDTSYVFDPTSLAAGNYKVLATVTDSGIATSTFDATVILNVVASDAKVDSDGDGVADDKDTYTESNLIATTSTSTAAPVATESGLKIVVGDAATASGTDGVQIDESTVVSSGDDGLGAADNGVDEEYGYPGGVFDFVVQDLPVPGQSINVVLPVPNGIPGNAIYRKFESTKGWFTFESDDDNYVSSSAGTATSCPSAGSELYAKGLTQGDFCIQLTIKDGGANDADGSVNGIVDDPGGIAVDDNAPVVTAPGDISVEAESSSGVAVTNETVAAFLAGATALDGADGDVTANITTDAGANIALGDNVITFSAVDTAGNTGTATATASVVDTTAPALTVPLGVTVTATSGNGIASNDTALTTFFSGASATDAADESPVITNDAPATLSVGTVTVTFTATDASGNASSGSAVVTVNAKKDDDGGAFGCSMGNGKGPIDPSLPLLVALALLGMFRKRLGIEI